MRHANPTGRLSASEWLFIILPGRTTDTTTTTSLRTKNVLEVRDVRSFIPSKFEIRSGDPFQPFWRITLAWVNGDDQPPYQHRDEENLLPPLDGTQQSLFGGDTDLSQGSPEAGLPLFEGTAYQIELTAFERNPDARRRCVEHYGARCIVCGFDFGASYGPVASGFIHVHHLVPLSEIAEAYAVDPIADLNPLCPNCHAVAHLRTPPYTIEEIKAFLAAR